MTQPTDLPGLRRRIAGIAYESLLLLGVLSVSFIVPHLALGMGLGIVAPGWFLFLHFFGVLGAYFIWYWHHGGQTLAMQTWKLQLVRADGGKPTLQQLIVRYVLAWSIPLLMVYALQRLLGHLSHSVPHWYPLLGAVAGLVWACFDRNRQFLHDRLAGTRIIFKR